MAHGLVAKTVKNLHAMQEAWVRSLGQKDPLEKGSGYPIQYPCLENSMDRGAWRTTVHGGHKESDTPEGLTLPLPWTCDFLKLGRA